MLDIPIIMKQILSNGSQYEMDFKRVYSRSLNSLKNSISQTFLKKSIPSVHNYFRVSVRCEFGSAEIQN